MGNNTVCVVVGMVDIVLRTNSGVEFIFKKVKHVREIKRNLISIGSLDQEGYSIKAKKRCLKVIIGLMVILKGELNNVLYILRTPMHSLNITQNSVKSGLNESMLWHYRLVHVSCKGLKVIRKKGLLGNMNVKDLHFWEECIKGKASRLNFASNTYRASNVLDYAHANLWGPAKAQSLTGARYHFDGTARQFFEGWYFKVSIPEKKQNFCFMYTVENPAFLKKLTPIEEAKYGRRFTGVGAQILGADDKYICQYTEENQNFWGSRHKLRLGSTFIAGPNWQPPKGELPPKEFDRRVLEGFQVSPLWNQGCIQDDGRSDYVETVKTARWQYSTQPVYGWGNVGSKQKSTAGWLAVFPVFEPHWQICMSAGLSTGWIEWDGERFEFENAPSYSEKNWGGAFPSKWFWVQCNVFEGANKEVALTAAGGLRQLAGGMVEDAALVGVHYDGIFYEFVPWNGTIEWEIAPWGFWKISADNGKYKVELEAITEHQGTTLRAPTLEAGLAPACKDSCYGNLKLQIWERRSDGARGKIILDVTSDMAAVEIGGGPWLETWKGTTTTPELVKHALSVPIDMESIFDVIPFFKPPGL